MDVGGAFRNLDTDDQNAAAGVPLPGLLAQTLHRAACL